MEEIPKMVQIHNKRKTKDPNSKIFKHILSCLENEKHIHMLRYSSLFNDTRTDFEIKFMNKKNKNWTEKDISLFKELDSLSSRVRDENKYEEMCKVRFKANISKLVKCGVLKHLHCRKESKSVKWKTYRILKPPAKVDVVLKGVPLPKVSDIEKNFVSSNYATLYENNETETREIHLVVQENVSSNEFKPTPILSEQNKNYDKMNFVSYNYASLYENNNDTETIETNSVVQEKLLLVESKSDPTLSEINGSYSVKLEDNWGNPLQDSDFYKHEYKSRLLFTDNLVENKPDENNHWLTEYCEIQNGEFFSQGKF